MTLERGSRAFARRAWTEAYELLTAADAEVRLEPADLERLAQAAYLIGHDAEAAASFTRAHHLLLERGQTERAARWGFWLSLHALLGGDAAQSTGWLSRIQRLVGDGTDRPEQAYVSLLSGLRQMGQGDAEGASATFDHVMANADRFRDPDLLALGLLGRGQALVQMQRAAEGVLQLDEAMITVATADVSPMATGIVYCAVILTCQRIFDVQRCKEWTQVLSAWCATQPDLVAFRGQCLVHRSEILHLEGEWSDAMSEAERAIDAYARRHEHAGGRPIGGRSCCVCGEGSLAPRPRTGKRAAGEPNHNRASRSFASLRGTSKPPARPSAASRARPFGGRARAAVLPASRCSALASRS